MHTTRIASLDLLRGVASFSVAVPHYLILALGSSPIAERVSVLAVEVFFVLSGFVLAPQIIACINDRRLATLGVFLVRRWMRTVPPYLFALLLISLIADQLLTGDFFRYAFYLQNLFAQHNAADYFPVAWSLSIEEWFYVSFPIWALLFTACVGRWDTPWLVGLALAFIAAITVARTLLGHYDDWGPLVRRVVVFRVDSIAYGFLLYLFVRRIGPRLASERSAYLGIAVPALVFVLAAYGAFALTAAIADQSDHWLAHLFPVCAAAFGSSAIVLLYAVRGAFQKPPLVAACCDYMGKISYSVYLFHLMVALGVRASFGDLPLLAQLGIFVAACLGGATVFFHYFERPILAARPRYRFVLPAAAPADPQPRAPSRPAPDVAVDRA